ncbi:MAG TPA: hypothetical protein PKD00_00780 [Burkholderiales bacterium]|nr:hypothetical protein [Burkholderiales bacterium]
MKIIEFSKRYTVSYLILNPFYNSFLPEGIKISEMGIINTFLFYGDKEIDRNENSCFLLFEESIFSEYLLYFITSEYFIKLHDLGDYIIVELRLPYPNMKDIILKGEYSELLNYGYHEKVNKNSMGYKIVTKDAMLRLSWQRLEEDLECTILESSEVYPKPLKKDETYLTSIKQIEWT